MELIKRHLNSYLQFLLLNHKMTKKGLSRRKCPIFQETKQRILIIIWIIIEILTLNFMFLTRKLAVSVNYIVFGALIYNGEGKK